MSIHVRIVTRRAVAWDGIARTVQAPGFTGEFGILPDHMQLLTLVLPGRVLIQTDEGEVGFIAGSGFAEAGPDRLTLLTDHLEPIKDIDHEKALLEMHSADNALVNVADGTAEGEMAERRALLARARVGA